jgi:hypothetical protein
VFSTLRLLSYPPTAASLHFINRRRSLGRVFSALGCSPASSLAALTSKTCL